MRLLLILLLILGGCNKKIVATIEIFPEKKNEIVDDNDIIFGEHLDGVELIKPKPEIIPWSTTLYFKFDSYALTEDAKDKLSDIPENAGELYLYGHTCDIGEEAYNFTLGLRRAKAVYDHLPSHECNIQSRGESEPISSNKSLNRRVLITNFPQ